MSSWEYANVFCKYSPAASKREAFTDGVRNGEDEMRKPEGGMIPCFTLHISRYVKYIIFSG
ncbi:hypothetical protein DWW14_11750 [Bacteroides uniformis]|uniref:Uncharacterized protein n=1 Tax=Bacteroides uniformis TaxID=820 RepID=A0A412XEK8_BACUN|nr:hypothetical protein DWW14_11750 [Bacteroides uniformis]RGV89988.1 hypothetical protein DWV99_13950 [Bacteroides uniformis]